MKKYKERKDKGIPKFGVPEHLKDLYTEEEFSKFSSYKRYNLRKGRPKIETRFDITEQEYQKKYIEQGGVCAICSNPEFVTYGDKIRKLAVDHDHVTGKIRGLLCTRCNMLLGYGQDQKQRLQDAIDYLEFWNDE